MDAPVQDPNQGSDQVEPQFSAPQDAGRAGNTLPQAGFLRTAPVGYDRSAIRDPGALSAALTSSVAMLAGQVANIQSGQIPDMEPQGTPQPAPTLRATNLPASGNPLLNGDPSYVPPDRGSLETFLGDGRQPAPQPGEQPGAPKDFAARFRTPSGPPTNPAGDILPPPPIDPSLERIEINDPADPRVAHAFAKLRTDLRAQQQYSKEVAAAATQAKTEIENAKKERDSLAAILEAERTRVKDLDEKVSKLSLVESPSFRQKFDAPLDDVVSKTTKFLLEGGMAPDARVAEKRAKELLAADAADIVEATESLPRSVVNQMVALASKYGELSGERERALKDWKVAKTAAEKSYDMSSTEERIQNRRQLADKALDHARSVSPILSAMASRDMEAAREVETQFSAFAQHATDEELMKCASEGFIAQEMYDELTALRAQNAELRARMEGRRLAGHPPIGPTYTAPAAPSAPPAAPTYTPPNVRAVNPNPHSSRSYLETVIGPEVASAQAPLRQRGRMM